MRDERARTGHSVKLPLLPRPITSPRTPFFCVVNSRVQNVALESSRSDAVSKSSRRHPWNSCTSAVVNGDVSDGPAVYSPGRSKKKKARAIILEIALVPSLFAAKARAMMCLMMRMGIGFTRCGGGSSRLYEAVIR